MKLQKSKIKFSLSWNLWIIIRLGKTPGQVLIRWSVQHGFITIPKTSQKSRLQSNADVFDWSIPDEDMKVLVSDTF